MVRAAIAFWALAACSRPAPTVEGEPPAPVLTLDEVEARMHLPNVYLFDANPREMYDRNHLPGAKWVQWNGVTSEDLPADRAASLVFYCANEWCTASHESARLALGLGYKHVFLMPRGIIGWKKAGKPVESSSLR